MLAARRPPRCPPAPPIARALRLQTPPPDCPTNPPGDPRPSLLSHHTHPACSRSGQTQGARVAGCSVTSSLSPAPWHWLGVQAEQGTRLGLRPSLPQNRGRDIDSGCSAGLGPLPSPRGMTVLEPHQGGASAPAPPARRGAKSSLAPGQLCPSPMDTQQLPLVPVLLPQSALPPPPCPPPPLPSQLVSVVTTVPHTLCLQLSMWSWLGLQRTPSKEPAPASTRSQR